MSSEIAPPSAPRWRRGFRHVGTWCDPAPMNGGMGRSGRSPFRARLVDRITPQPAATVADVPALPPPDLKHVWVTDEHGRRAGLLLRWERRDGTWWGRVTYAVPDGDGWALVEDWVPAEQLEPA